MAEPAVVDKPAAVATTEAQPIAGGTASTTVRQEQEKEIVALETDPEGVRERINQLSGRVKERDEKLRARDVEFEKLQKEYQRIAPFVKWAEERGYTEEQITAMIQQKPADPAKPASTTATEVPSKDAKAKELFGVEKFEELAQWEKKLVMQDIREAEREAEAAATKEKTRVERIKATQREIAKECVDVLKTDEFKGVEGIDPEKLYEFMWQNNIIDTLLAARALYHEGLKKHWISNAESGVKERTNRAPDALETTTAVQPGEKFTNPDMTQDILETLRAKGTVDPELLRR